MQERNEISRRRVVAGAAWAAPAIVVASSAPAWAGSTGDPNVTAFVEPTADANNALPVTISFQNSGTGDTGLLIIDVFFTTNLAAVNGTLSDAAPTLDPTSVSAGWAYDSVRGTIQRRIFTFTHSRVRPPGT